LISELISDTCFEISETKIKESQYPLEGTMKLLKVLISKSDKFEIKNLDALQFLLIKLLFSNNNPNAQIVGLFKIKTPAYELLSEIISKLGKTSNLIEYLAKLYEKIGWRSEKQSDWEIIYEAPNSVSSNFVGLVNMGATCYVNSIIQQLFMLPCIRNPILELDCSKAKQKNILTEMQNVFGVLYQKQVPFYKAKPFYDFMKVDPEIQRDASEFLINLIDLLGNSFKNTPYDDLIKNLFEIQTSTQITCKKCSHVNEIPATSILLGLEVKGKKKLAEGLESFLRPEVLQGHNAYFCSKCDTKVDAEKRDIIKGLPNILLVQLKRFEMLYSADANQKVNSYYEFPTTLDMRPYFNNSTSSNHIYHDLHKEYCKYTLKGVVIHTGTVNAGHYYSLIKDPNNPEKWMQFNDTMVYDFDINNLAEEAFGSKNNDGYEKTHNAYILVYERTVQFTENILSNFMQKDVDLESLDQEKLLKEFESAKELSKINKIAKIDPTLNNLLIEEQKEFTNKQILFNPAFSQFVLNLAKCDLSKDENATKLSDFITSYFFLCAVRNNSKCHLYEMTEILCKNCEINTKLAIDIIHYFSLPSILHEFILDCPRSDSRKCVSSLVKCAISIVYKNEEDLCKQYFNSPADKIVKIPELAYLSDNLLAQFEKLNRNYIGQYFEILTHLAKQNMLINRFLRNCACIGATMELLGLPISNSWKKYVSDANPHLKLECETLIKPSKDCFIVAEKTLSEKLFSEQIYYLFDFLTELLKPYENKDEFQIHTIDFEEIDLLIKETVIKQIIKTIQNNSIAQCAYANLIETLTIIKEQEYCIPLLNIIVGRFGVCEMLEIPVCLKIIEYLLNTKSETLFKEIFSRIISAISSELKKAYDKDYFTITLCIDFIIRLSRNNMRCLEIFIDESRHEMTRKLFELIFQWIDFNMAPKEGQKLFRGIFKLLPRENLNVLALSKQANIERKSLLSRLVNVMAHEPIENLKKLQISFDTMYEIRNSIKIGQKIDTFKYFFFDKLIKSSKIKQWKKGEIIGNCQNAFIKIKENTDEYWIEWDSDKISPENTKFENNRAQEIISLVNLYYQFVSKK